MEEERGGGSSRKSPRLSANFFFQDLLFFFDASIVVALVVILGSLLLSTQSALSNQFRFDSFYASGTNRVRFPTAECLFYALFYRDLLRPTLFLLVSKYGSNTSLVPNYAQLTWTQKKPRSNNKVIILQMLLMKGPKGLKLKSRTYVLSLTRTILRTVQGPSWVRLQLSLVRVLVKERERRICEKTCPVRPTVLFSIGLKNFCAKGSDTKVWSQLPVQYKGIKHSPSTAKVYFAITNLKHQMKYPRTLLSKTLYRKFKKVIWKVKLELLFSVFADCKRGPFLSVRGCLCVLPRTRRPKHF